MEDAPLSILPCAVRTLPQSALLHGCSWLVGFRNACCCCGEISRCFWAVLLQDSLDDNTTVLSDTGDAQFNAMKLKLPEKAG